jgi:hypothetical protein
MLQQLQKECIFHWYRVGIYLSSPQIPRPDNIHYKKYQAVSMDTVDTESPLTKFYCKIVEQKPETRFFPGIKRVHLDLVILCKDLDILEIYIPNITQYLILENIVFQYGGMLYCAVHQRKKYTQTHRMMHPR